MCAAPASLPLVALARVADLGLPAAELADRLLADAGVACLPGTAFGVHGEGYLRLSYANTVDSLHRALTRIQRVVAGG